MKTKHQLNHSDTVGKRNLILIQSHINLKWLHDNLTNHSYNQLIEQNVLHNGKKDC